MNALATTHTCSYLATVLACCLLLAALCGDGFKEGLYAVKCLGAEIYSSLVTTTTTTTAVPV